MHALKQEAIFSFHKNANAMMGKKNSKNRIKKTIFGLFFAIIGIFGAVNSVGLTEPVYAEPATETVEETTVEEEATPEEVPITDVKANSASCKESLGELGWWVCPETGKIAEATDWLYEKIEDILIINPVEMKDGAPIYEIWKYFRGITNLVFIIFMLIVVISQITGIGITNYGIKKALPKLIIAAILVNLSFIICSLAVELSNVFGIGIRDVFSNIETATYYNMQFSNLTSVSLADIYASLAGGEVLAVGAGIVAFETGAIWMLIPVVLGAIVAVAAGLITIALRQAVVTLLIMIAPLAIVAYILPNTEQWFKKWKNLFIQMLVFYPMFSLLFGASSLAGFAIIASAKDGFSLLLGVAVQIFPLFFSWSLMKMSGTFLSNVNAKIRAIGAKPLASTRSWAESRRESTKMRRLASENVYTPSLYLRQYLSDRKIHREEETKENAETVKNRGLAYSARKHYKDWKNGVLNGEGKEAYEVQARNMRYKRTVQRHTNNMNEGFSGHLTKGTVEYDRLAALDKLNMDESDRLKMEMARGEQIDYRNAKGFHERMEAAMNAHMDELHWNKVNKKGKLIYKRHFDSMDNKEFIEAKARYNVAKDIMNGNLQDAHYTAAYAAHAYDTQMKIISTKFQKYFELTPPTRDVRYRLEEFSHFANKLNDGTFDGKAVDNIDAIISGLRILNQRGDTDLAKNIIEDLVNKKYGGLELGTHASQALASFLMFDVKDNDPFLRRFGKYINLETARIYDKNERQQRTVDFEEYIKGYHYEMNPDTGKVEPFYAKKPMNKLLEGTAFDNIERTAMSNMDDSLKAAYGYDPENKAKNWDKAGWLKKLKETMTAIEPQFLSANQKYLSGSEQINSFVKFWTGYTVKPKKHKNKDGIEEFVLDDKGEQVFDIAPIWNDEEFSGFEDKLKEFYKKNTVDFYKDQTTAQVLNTRTDWRGPSVEHLLATYLTDPTVDKNILEQRNLEYGKAKAAVIAKYKNDESKDADKKRETELQELKNERASAQLIKILGESGKLKQIYRTRSGGTAINSKDWFRRMVHLDDEGLLQKEVAYYDKLMREKKEKEQQNNGADSASENQGASRIYDENFREACKSELYDMYDTMRDDTPAVFFGATMEAIHDWFGGGNSIIERDYKKYYDDHKDIITVSELSLYLDDLLNDMDKYPDA